LHGDALAGFHVDDGDAGLSAGTTANGAEPFGELTVFRASRWKSQ
jgi:hypothetical protein